MLTPGDLLPHFDVIDLDGRAVEYRATVWQRKHLLLAVGRSSAFADCPVEVLPRELRLMATADVEVVLTTTPVDGLPDCGVVVVDRWGEIAFVWDAASSDRFPDVQELQASLAYMQMRCPECEGEAR